MPTFNVRVRQVLRVDRFIILAIEADSLEDAIDLQSESDAPGEDDPRWVCVSDLMNEVCDAAP